MGLFASSGEGGASIPEDNEGDDRVTAGMRDSQPTSLACLM